MPGQKRLSLAGIGCAYFLGEKWRIADPIAALLVAVFIFKIALDLIRTGLGELLEKSLPADVEQEILSIVTANPDGWQLLFDGKTLDQWKDYNGTGLTMPWHVVDGCIQANGDGSDLTGYIVTRRQYENFILDWEWKLSRGGNSGMLYHVVEDPAFAATPGN